MKKTCIVLICFLVACSTIDKGQSVKTDKENGTSARSK